MKKTDKLTNEEIRAQVEKNSKRFMKAVRTFLATKAGSTEVPVEWEMSIIMLETYYKEFLELTLRIEQMDSLTVTNRYGEVPHPILTVRDRSAARLESILKQLGLTLKSGISLNVVEAQKSESPLDKFLNKQNGKKVEKR